MSEFDVYIVHGEPGQKEKADAWQTAIGLQDVDGLKVSTYLLDTARQHIEGDISIDDARDRIRAYMRLSQDMMLWMKKAIKHPSTSQRLSWSRPLRSLLLG